MILPKEFEWLYNIGPLPKMLQQSIYNHGCVETPGAQNNAVILGWAHELGEDIEKVYKADSIPWCGLYMGILASRAGYEVPRNPLWALSWASFGVPVDIPMLGDVLVFTRKGGGHVSLYTAETHKYYICHGGNQSDEVNFTKIEKSRLYVACRPIWKLGPPPSRKRYFVNASGILVSRKET